ncbi:chromosome segregation protein SMC [Neptunicoccus cionae]|uniref:chromosome segregation protein SMC n=1 Tax=Neptunicoccus cionae TaxID=2035344 RepID=UPI000C7677AC|nr:chromosome segregation protein SMC [Amylibacter cionae]PLS21776.1 chromosome segregation protein SMC [Amylibacter cionae]
MQFSKIRLTGFKSFVDPTELIISDGLTGVVGPNGCGKSNLLEALRWVMGENRPTAMRGGGMEDVIFAGAASRPARNFAEVMLTLDNKERLAPAAFNDSDTLEVVRRITRDAGSAYKTNGKEARARDVQMLFADASTGAHSPALVRQGQISELINAKPKSRRRVLEEAAGISGLYQRRHEAELKLNGAESNLARLDDVIEQLDSQLNALARQARQAARYRAILDELRQSEGLLLYRRWREADLSLAKAVEQLQQATQLAAAGQGGAAKAAALRKELEGKVPPLREEETVAGAILQRLTAERDALGDQESRARATIETLQNRIEQLGKDIDRETGLNRDAEETIKRLEWEQEALLKASEGQEERIETAAAEAKTAAAVMQEKEADLDRHTEDVARLAARHQSAHRLLQDVRGALKKREEQAETAAEAVTKAKDGLAQAEARLSEASKTHSVAQEAALRAETRLGEIETRRAEEQARDSDARAALSEAEGEANALNAEVGALERVIARDQSGGAQLLDEVRARKGYEAALGASLADDLKAPVVGPAGVSGWAQMPDYESAAALPQGAIPLADYVTAPDVLSRRLSQTGVVPREQGAALQGALKPGQRLVSVEGDLWRWDGYRAGADDAPTAAALRLQQVNRLEDLRESHQSAAQTAAHAREVFETAHAALQDTIAADQEARRARKVADETANSATRAMSRAEADRDMLSGRVETLTQTLARLQEEALAATTAVKEAEAAVRELGDLDAARETVEALKVAVEAARVTMLTKRSIHDEQRRDGEARIKRRQEITQEVSGWRHRLETAEARIAELASRKETSEQELKEATAAPDEIRAKREELGREIEKAENRVKAASDALSVAETNLRQAEQGERDAERAASEAREARARADAVADSARVQVDTAADRIREELEISPEKLLERLQADPEDMPPVQMIENDVARLRRQRDSLGAVNLRAEEDAKEVTEERDTLVTEKADLEEAIKTLRTGIASLNREGRERLLAAFDEVNSNFALLFKHLFGGGDANLVLVESDDPLEAGLEIMCQPPGKKLSTLSLLSGGEQTLTALSLIFAVFLANPSPICVLDEVDAPLDDANVTRFCDLLDEMTRRTDTRFLIITHHAVTMSRMDRLFGVTMAELGVSQLVSVDLQQAELLVG